MSELKAIRSGEIYNIIEYEDCYRTDDLYYPKSDADKVIAGLKEHIKSLIRLNHFLTKEHIGIIDMTTGETEVTTENTNGERLNGVENG